MSRRPVMPPLPRRLRASAMTRAVAAALALVLAGCAAVGPDYTPPTVALDPAFIGAGSSSLNSQPPAADIARFWRGFGDAQLNTLMDRALAANGDLRIAQARLQEARAGQDEAEAATRPGLGLDASAERSTRPLTQQPGASRSARTGNAFNASFIAAWEIDLFGRLRRGNEQALALAEAGSAGVAAAQTSVAAEVARNYMQLRGLQQQLVHAQASLQRQRESLRITQARADAGRSTQLDLARASGLVASTEAALPALQGAIEGSIFRLATLTAQPPRAMLAALAAPAPLPALPLTDLASLPAGTPAAWLQRRPDLIAAERELAAATAGIGIARSELYPQLSLSGLLGLNAATLGSFGSFGSSAAARYAVGAGLSWTPFDLGAVRARIRASQARSQQSLARFEQAVAGALEETEGAFSSFTRNAQRADRLAQAVRSADEAAGLARLRFDAGVTDFLAVLDAERELLSQRDQLVQAQVGTATALVAVYRALGGGWDAPVGAAAAVQR